MRREYYSDSIANFLKTSSDEILGKIVSESDFAVEQSQRDAWLEQIRILRKVLAAQEGTVYFEYSIPRMGSAKAESGIYFFAASVLLTMIVSSLQSVLIKR